jgi:hypothetical protein
MGWHDRIISNEDLQPYFPSDGRSLASKVAALIEHQRKHWPMLREGYESFRAIETKRLRIQDAEVVVQHNPRRIKSSAAQVDIASIASRPCFLCPENLPPEERALVIGNLVLLCNPYPVLDHHLSIVDRQHGRQRIDGNVGSLLGLARELGPEYFALYNGPECGASAPDHLHFQACSSALLPISEHLFNNGQVFSGGSSMGEEDAESFELYTLGGCGRTTVVLRGGNPRELEKWLYRFIDEIRRQTGKQEPLLNIICCYSSGIWTIYVFPRARHRPSCFYADGPERLLVSPGAIDMAGVVVVPEREHFERIDAEQLGRIYHEVSYNEAITNDIVDWMTSAQEMFFRE